jgi:hypothetical protein
MFKGAAAAAIARPGPFRDYYEASLARGVKDDLAMVTLARKFGAVGGAICSRRAAATLGGLPSRLGRRAKNIARSSAARRSSMKAIVKDGSLPH